MGHITYGDAIAILDVVFYAPFFLIVLYLAIRHRSTSFAWFILAVFCLVRIVGACARLDTVVHPDSDAAWTTALICSIFGLSPLLMATLGVLSRAYRDVKTQPYQFIFKGRLVNTAVHAPATAAVVLCIVGATNASSAADIPNQILVKIGIILLTVVLLAIATLAMAAFVVHRRTAEGERILIASVLCAIPFLLVRLIYALVAIFNPHSKTFSLVHGNQTVVLCMSVLEEMVVVLIYVIAGLKLPAVSKYEHSRTSGRRAGGRRLKRGSRLKERDNGISLVGSKSINVDRSRERAETRA